MPSALPPPPPPGWRVAHAPRPPAPEPPAADLAAVAAWLEARLRDAADCALGQCSHDRDPAPAHA